MPLPINSSRSYTSFLKAITETPSITKEEIYKLAKNSGLSGEEIDKAMQLTDVILSQKNNLSLDREKLPRGTKMELGIHSSSHRNNAGND